MGGATRVSGSGLGGDSTEAGQAEGAGEAVKMALEGIVTNKNIVVHPLVLLSVVDHYNRVASGTNKRVVGTLLGETQKDGTIHVTNSFAVPFEEDAKDSTVWFLDHCYHESLFHMFKKVNVKERVMGWYSTGPKIRPADLEIHELYRKYCSHPVYLIVDATPKEDVSPTEAYMSFEEATCETQFRRKFVHLPSSIGAYEPEEIGVEHLLRDIKNASASTLSSQITDKAKSLKSLASRLREIALYLEDVVTQKLPSNPKILYNVQHLINMLPDMEDKSLKGAFAVDANDTMLALYIGAMIRSVSSLHSLVNNKIENRMKQDKTEAEESLKQQQKEEKTKADENAETANGASKK